MNDASAIAETRTIDTPDEVKAMNAEIDPGTVIDGVVYPARIDLVLLDGSEAQYTLVQRPVNLSVPGRDGVEEVRMANLHFYVGPCPGCHRRMRTQCMSQEESLSHAHEIALPVGTRHGRHGALRVQRFTPFWCDGPILRATMTCLATHAACFQGKVSGSAWMEAKR